jgi:perosamine synthetase
VALYAILKGRGIGAGDEVILPGYTCVMAVNPIVYLRAKPVFVDIEPVTYNLDPDRIERAITPRTRLIIAQHTYGYPVHVGPVMDLARRKGPLPGSRAAGWRCPPTSEGNSAHS